MFSAACLYPAVTGRDYLFSMTPFEVSRSTYGVNPFPEAVEVGQYILSHSDTNARIAVLGSESEIPFYARRRSASGFLFTYSLTEPSQYAAGLQQQMIRELEAARPEYVVVVNAPTSWYWLPNPNMSRTIFTWVTGYIRQNYELAGVADNRMEEPEYYWDDAARNFVGPPPVLAVYRRRER